MSINNYIKTETNFFKSIQKLEDKNLLFYCITGSLGRSDLIQNWSDIDILMVFKKYSLKLFSNLYKLLEKNKSSIKIGITFYSLEEFNHSHSFKDIKTYHNIEMINKKIYVPKIIHKLINLPVINRKMIIQYDQADLGKYLHSIKRELINSHNFDERSVYKQIVSIIKILLYKQDIISYGYKMTIDNATKFLNNFNNNFPLPEDIIKYPDKKEDRYNIYINFLKWIGEQNA